MSAQETPLSGPDLGLGIALSSLPDGSMLQGHAGNEPVVLVRRGDRLYAISAYCTHYGAPLAGGLVVGETLRCPWHHACFSLDTGRVLRAPARDPLERWRVEEANGIVHVREKLAPPAVNLPKDVAGLPRSVVIVGGGPAGNAAAETLRREGYGGKIRILSADPDLPCDRPNLSKNYLAGTAPSEWIPLRTEEFYRDHGIDIELEAPVVAIDVARCEVIVADGTRHPYDAMLLATGSSPVRLEGPGAEFRHVHYVRSFADARGILEEARHAKRVAIIGSSFIGLEVAASLRTRGLEVDVVGRSGIPMGSLLGPQVGSFIRGVHEDHGVSFHLGCSARTIGAKTVSLSNGEQVEADLVIVGIGVEPNTSLAQQAGLAVDHGVIVNEFLQTSAPNVYAAGDIARWPDPFTGEKLRIEHFVVAERQGETAARNMLGQGERFEAIPFFWTEQYDLGIAYVGHGAGWNSIDIEGDIRSRDCAITYRRDGRKVAVALIHRDRDGLRQEVEFERWVECRNQAEARTLERYLAE
jgi:NADPH-dependent 2,4-dienoyl-CoA reductase/sulfur reductase-like enzyme/nitrite reductase/ring-hydroxylating ferredoxin subunit